MKVKVEVADTPYKLAAGLMHRTNLANDAGMLFIFPSPQVLKFWGENTLIPLDIAFIDHTHKIASVGHIKCMDRTMVSSGTKCIMAIEVNSGWLSQNGIKVGDRISVSKGDVGTTVQFEKNAGTSGSDSESNTKTAAIGRRKRRFDVPGQMDLPFGDQQPEAEGQEWQPTSLDDVGGFNDASNPDEDSQLPELDINDISLADDDDSDDNSEGIEVPDGEQEPLSYEDEKSQDALEPPSGEQVPDASSMATGDAIRMAIENGYVMLIGYSTLPQKRSIGPLYGPKTITRIVQPHGVFHARTTHNTILVTWDMSVNDFRSFVLDRINLKEFTGQRFNKWFRVRD